MKKMISALLAVFLMLAPSACGTAQSDAQSPSASASEQTSAQDSGAADTQNDLGAMDDAQLTKTLKPYFDVYGLVLSETFGTHYSDKGFVRLYESADAAMASELADVKAMLPEAELNDNGGLQTGGEYDGLAIDPSYAVCYPVDNFESMDAVADSLRIWMANGVFLDSLKNNLIENDGALYLVRGGRGYGSESIDPASAKRVGAADGSCTVQVDGYQFEEACGTVTATFRYGADGILLESVEWNNV